MSGKGFPVSKISPSDTQMGLNCRTTRPILLYLEEKCGREAMEEAVYSTNMNLDYLEDRSNWVSYDYFFRLLAKLVEYTDDPQAPFVAGTYTTRKDRYGSIGRFFSRLGTPGTTYKLIARYARTFGKLAEWRISDFKKNSCIIHTRFPDGFEQDKNNCLNVQGILASVPTLWDLPLANVQELQCCVGGGNACVYKVSWRNRPTHMFGLAGLLAGGVLFAIARVLLEADQAFFMSVSIPVLGYLLGRIIDHRVALKDSIAVNEEESRALLESVETIERLNVELQGKVERRTAELQKAMEDLKESQARLIQSEKMASVGRLAGGMAHELNNPVAAVRSYLQDILDDTPEEDSRWDRLRRAEKATGRCRRIVSDLLTFAREEKVLQMVDINDTIQAAVSAAEETAGPKIVMAMELQPDLARISVDPMQIQQVLTNLIVNACDAVKEEGEILVAASAKDENICIAVSDNGEGIPQDIQNKIFDPFFTTKAPGKGIGLGLAISYNIIKRFNGDIQVKSDEGKGTTVTVSLPIGGHSSDGVQKVTQ